MSGTIQRAHTLRNSQEDGQESWVKLKDEGPKALTVAASALIVLLLLKGRGGQNTAAVYFVQGLDRATCGHHSAKSGGIYLNIERRFYLEATFTIPPTRDAFFIHQIYGAIGRVRARPQGKRSRKRSSSS